MAVAAIAAGVGIASSFLGGKSAGKISSRNAKRALAEVKRQFDLVFETLAPFRDLGESAITELQGLLGLGGKTGAEIEQQLLETPGVQLKLKAVEDAVENSAAARSGLLSGRAVTEAAKGRVNVLGQELERQTVQLGEAARIGLGAAGGTATAATAAGAQSASIFQEQGTTQAQIALGTASNINTQTQGAIQNFQFQKRLGELTPKAA